MAGKQGKRVMIAVDDSDASAHAFEWAIGNFVREGDHLIILSASPYVNLGFPNADVAVEYGVPIVVASGPESEKAEKKATSHSKRLVQKYVDQAHAKNISCEGEVVKGDAGSWIVDEGERVKADAIVVGSNAKGLFQRTFVGSVSDYVLHNSPCTVAIVRTPEETKTLTEGPLSPKSSRKIVIAVDEEREAIYAFTWALKHFCKPADHVILYHVHQPSFTPVTRAGAGQFGIEEVYVPLEMSTRDDVESLKQSQKIVEKFMKYADKETKIHCEGMVVTGQTEAKVIDGLVSLKAHAVVVGTHDRGAVARTFLGSVSDHLAHNSPCPLIVAKPRKEGKVGAASSQTETESKVHAP